MENILLNAAIAKLQEQYLELDWTYHDLPNSNSVEKMYFWPGDAKEDILICVHKSNGVQELFHRHNFFYFNYTYKGQYESLSYKYDRRILIREKELYAGQPFAGHALFAHGNNETIIFGVLIQQETFFRYFLPMFSTNSRLFHFFLDPTTNHFSEEFIHFKLENDNIIQNLLEMSVIEYANKKADTQNILRALILTFLLHVARQYSNTTTTPTYVRLSDKIIQYMSEHNDITSIKDISSYFSYHPNYISAVLRKETGKTFSEILQQQRMERALVLLKGTNLPIHEIANMLGYHNNSNFYKAFRQYYHATPRDYLNFTQEEK